MEQNSRVTIVRAVKHGGELLAVWNLCCDYESVCYTDPRHCRRIAHAFINKFIYTRRNAPWWHLRKASNSNAVFKILSLVGSWLVYTWPGYLGLIMSKLGYPTANILLHFLSGYFLVLRREQPQKYTPSFVNWDQRFEKGISPRSPSENANFAQVVIAERNIISICALVTLW